MIQYIKINNTNQIQINDSGKQVYYSGMFSPYMEKYNGKKRKKRISTY